MAVVAVQCPECERHEVVRYGRQANGEQRYRCNNVDCERRIFLVRYHKIGRLPEVKRQMGDMAADFGHSASILVVEEKDPPCASLVVTPIAMGPVSLPPP